MIVDPNLLGLVEQEALDCFFETLISPFFLKGFEELVRKGFLLADEEEEYRR